jgi:hypothetical protein
MPEPELHVRDFTPPVPTVLCDSGQHFPHPGETCEEIEELQAVFRAYLERALRQAYAMAAAETARIFDERFITGDGTGEPRGILGWESREETSMERALAILDPHLRACPLYQAGPPTLYPQKG